MWINKKIKLIMLVILLVFIIGSVYVLSPFPINEIKVNKNLPNSFNVPASTIFDHQGKNQCAAFSTAFVLQNFGKSVKGSEVYSKLPFKIPVSGYVLPKGIVTYIQNQGFDATIFKGNINSLKKLLVQESAPIIVLVGSRLSWQHYMTFLGYNNEKEELYFYDSVKKNDENAELCGNRTIKENDFLKIWDNGLPIFNHIFIKVDEKL